jgi:hypothetical protein
VGFLGLVLARLVIIVISELVSGFSKVEDSVYVKGPLK